MNMTQDDVQNLLLEGGDNVKIVTLVYRKKGALRGSGDERCLYGDHKVAVTLLTGFNYGSVVQKSKAQLLQIREQDILAECKRRGLHDRRGEDIQKKIIREALAEVHQSLLRTIQGTNKSNHQKVFSPLMIEGQKVRGCKVYIGEGNPEDPRAPKPGTVYLQGLKISEVIIEEAPNGDIPEPMSMAKTVAKQVVRSRLHVGKYVSYELSPDREFKISLSDVDQVVSVVS